MGYHETRLVLALRIIYYYILYKILTIFQILIITTFNNILLNESINKYTSN